MLKNKIDFIANQCPALHKYLNELPSKHVSDFKTLNEELKSFFNIERYSLLTSSLDLDVIKSLTAPDYDCEILYSLVKKVIQTIFEDGKLLVVDFQGSKYVHFMNPYVTV